MGELARSSGRSLEVRIDRGDECEPVADDVPNGDRRLVGRSGKGEAAVPAIDDENNLSGRFRRVWSPYTPSV